MRPFSRAALVGLVCLLIAPAARAHHIPGATYRGTDEAGGKVEFKVSGNGRRVKGFKVFGPLPGSPEGRVGTRGQCTVTGPIALPPSGIGNHFALGNESLEQTYAVRFHRRRKARGGFEIVQNDACWTHEVKWTASTKATPVATRACKRQKKRLKRARQRLAEADNPSERTAARETLQDARRSVKAECS